MLSRTISNNSHKQVKCVLDDLVSNVVKKQRRVTWLKNGVSKVSTFQIEPWRKLVAPPVSKIKRANKEEAVPFILPLLEPQKIPIEDQPLEEQLWNDWHYNTYLQQNNTREEIQQGQHVLPRNENITLIDIYQIVNNQNIIKNYEKFIYDTSQELQLGNNR